MVLHVIIVKSESEHGLGDKLHRIHIQRVLGPNNATLRYLESKHHRAFKSCLATLPHTNPAM